MTEEDKDTMLAEIREDVKYIRRNFVPASTFWRVIGGVFIIAIGSYGAYLL